MCEYEGDCCNNRDDELECHEVEWSKFALAEEKEYARWAHIDEDEYEFEE